MPDNPTAKPVNFGDRRQWRARRLAFRRLIVRLLVRYLMIGRPPGNRLRHVCVRLRKVLDDAGPLPDQTFLALCGALERLLDIADAHALARDELSPKRQATHFRQAAEHLAKAGAILSVTGEPPGRFEREENSTLLDAAIEDLRGEDVDADLIRRERLESLALLEQELRRGAELATTPRWSMRVRPRWPLDLMERLVHTWTVILRRTAGASAEGGPFVRFVAACLELLGFPKPMYSAPAIRAEYRRHRDG